MRFTIVMSLILAGLLLASTSHAGDRDHAESERAVDAAVDKIVRELAAVGAGPSETPVHLRTAAPSSPVGSAPPVSAPLPGLRPDSLLNEAAAAQNAPGADEGEDDHAM